ncbi:MAG: hypothetical protein U0163_02055 [Gemmatimonadaceae bacterium]
MTISSVSRLIVLGGCLATAACGKKEAAPAAQAPAAPAPPPAPAVTAIELGRAIGDNGRVVDTTSVFKLRDTMYVSVVTENAGPPSALTAKWTYQTGQLVDSTVQPLARSDATHPTVVTQFHIAKKSAWPTGKYKVEISFDGQPKEHQGVRSQVANQQLVRWACTRARRT